MNREVRKAKSVLFDLQSFMLFTTIIDFKKKNEMFIVVQLVVNWEVLYQFHCMIVSAGNMVLAVVSLEI